MQASSNIDPSPRTGLADNLNTETTTKPAGAAPVAPAGGVRRLAYLVPEFPGQTHIFFWREITALRKAGIAITLVSSRKPTAACAHDFATPAAWTFEPLDTATFPAVELARECGKAGGTKPAVFNAANEECVAAFLSGGLEFLSIVDTVAEIVGHHENCGSPNLDDVLSAELWAREQAQRRVAG